MVGNYSAKRTYSDGTVQAAQYIRPPNDEEFLVNLKLQNKEAEQDPIKTRINNIKQLS